METEPDRRVSPLRIAADGGATQRRLPVEHDSTLRCADLDAAAAFTDRFFSLVLIAARYTFVGTV